MSNKNFKIMKIRSIILSLCVATCINAVQAQTKSSRFTPSENKNDIRISISDGTPMTMTNIFGAGFADAILGSKKTDEKVWAYLVWDIATPFNVSKSEVIWDLHMYQVNLHIPDKRHHQ